MKIISKFKDYYDSVVQYGQDSSLLYLREEYINKTPYPFPVLPLLHRFEVPSPYNARIGVIGFCGKIYPFIKITDSGDSWGKFKLSEISSYREHIVGVGTSSNITKYCYNMEDIDSFVNACFSQEQINKLYKAKYSNFSRRFISQFFDENLKKQNAFQEYFTYQKDEKKIVCPIFTSFLCRYDSNICYNDMLKSYEFYKIFDNYSAYQEIQMYLSNVAVPLPVIPTISNEDLLESKGFDLKQSFRKVKQK